MISSERSMEHLPRLDRDLGDRLARGRDNWVGEREHVVLHRDTREAGGDGVEAQRFLS